MWVRAILLAAALMLVPLGVRAADLVVWWDKAYYPAEDQALAELIKTFETKTGHKVELVRQEGGVVPEGIEAAIARDQPPDFMFALSPTPSQGQLERWAAEGWLVDLGDAIGGNADLFDEDILDLSTLANGQTGQRGLLALPMGRTTTHIHVWLSLLQRVGLKRDDIPTGWEPFWSFWCDKVQPAVREALGRQDIWGVGAPMSAEATDTGNNLEQFVYAYTDAWPTPSGPNLVSDPAARAALIRGLARYTSLYERGCTPPDARDWDSAGNNRAFLDQRVVMTINETLSIPRALKESRPDDYYRNAATIDWPSDTFGRPGHVSGTPLRAVVFKGGGHTEATKQFVRFLAEGGLARYLAEAGDRVLPPSRKLLDQPFWLDPSDPHRLRSAVQTMTRPHISTYGLDRGQLARLERKGFDVWGLERTTVHRVAADGLSPEQATDEAISRVKQLLSE
jgi:multiple sugar transport system substrate-binding protein